MSHSLTTRQKGFIGSDLCKVVDKLKICFQGELRKTTRKHHRPPEIGFNSRVSNLIGDIDLAMGFILTTLIFIAVGIIACFCTRVCCNKGPSANLFHLTLVITATICCWMMWAIVYLAQMNPLIVPILSEGE
ncbi:V-type proton ATPase subunit e1 [Lactuca sativa]|uniref:Uncharacterized protein n=1 Tax=Lactuca sativa TaxID=4236 RepID=A0A9R1VHI2_LACSA|nr:V-type proton ATPase subunit e1 [Lactuca sativa]KAJ0204821.1 hypothetical protein LSAT_V11C500229640 [Lactuca sativa]